MEISENSSLQSLHSFGCNEKTKYFAKIDSIEAIEKYIQWAKEKNIAYLILGAGSNILFTKTFEGLVLKMEIMGIKNPDYIPTEELEKLYVPSSLQPLDQFQPLTINEPK